MRFLVPNPPPTSRQITRTLSSAMPSAPHSERFWIRMPWPPARRVCWPLAGSYRPMAAAGSSGRPVTRLLRSSMRVTWAARANAASTSARLPRSPSQHRLSGAWSQIAGAPGATASATLDHGGQRLVVHPHQVGGLDGGGARLGDDHRHALAGVAHLVDGERIVRRLGDGASLAMGERHVARVRRVGDRLEALGHVVAPGQHREHAWRRKRRAGIDRADHARARAASAGSPHGPGRRR